jgi:cobalt-zinc-cadmium efflux system protein
VLGWSVAFTGSFMLVEAGVGVWSGGLALVADATHMLADTGALGLAYFASSWAQRPRTAKSTFGHRRAEVLAAFVNGIALGVTSLWIVYEAVERWRSPHDIRGLPMLVTALVGLLVNALIATVLMRAREDSLNVRAALAHVMMDALGSLGACAAAGFVLAFGITRADAVISVGIAILVAYSGWSVLRETVNILLEGAPAHLDVEAVGKAILECPGVDGIHDLHVWRISDRFDALTVHVTLAMGAHGVEVSRDVALRLRRDFGLEHVTVQPEAAPPGELVSLRLRREP